ncbi:MAG: DUF3299 domain-containing protein [Bdellovibrionales bacterium]|nr:DUF3299 domain-containing protein [Bdellovibrionales bacterium]
MRLPGFIVPLSDNYAALKEFLIVPDPQACVHVPPPPPNLIVYANLVKAIPFDEISNPSWFEGILKIETTKNIYGAASYKMRVDKLERYEFSE